MKSLCLGDEAVLGELSRIVSSEGGVLIGRGRQTLDEILSHYTDFQVRTIDSFMTTLFKTSAIDFGYAPDFEILMDPGALMEYAFNLLLRKVRTGSSEGALLDRIVRIIQEHQQEGSSYLWDPSEVPGRRSGNYTGSWPLQGRDPSRTSRAIGNGKSRRGSRESLDRLDHLISESGLERSGGRRIPESLLR